MICSSVVGRTLEKRLFFGLPKQKNNPDKTTMKTSMGFLTVTFLAVFSAAGATNEPPQLQSAPLLAVTPTLAKKAVVSVTKAAPKWAASTSIRTNAVTAVSNVSASSKTNALSTTNATEETRRESRYYLKPMSTEALAERGMLIGWEIKKRKK